MIRKPIRNLHSNEKHPPRFCDVIVDGDEVSLETKTEKKGFRKIPWEDVVYQVEAAKALKK